MKSPVPRSLLAWALRPRPTGLRRYAAGYLCVAAGIVAATMIIAIFDHTAGHCTAGFACLGLIFRGLVVGGLVGVLLLLAGAIITKLGAAYAVAVIGFSAPIVAAAALVAPELSAAWPVALGLLVAVPTLAARVTLAVDREPTVHEPRRAVRRPRTAAGPRRSLQPLPR